MNTPALIFDLGFYKENTMSFSHISVPVFASQHDDLDISFCIDNDGDINVFSFVFKTDVASIALTIEEINDIEKIIDDHFEKFINPSLNPNETVYDWGSGKMFLDIDGSTIRFLEERDNYEITMYLSRDWHEFVQLKNSIKIIK